MSLIFASNEETESGLAYDDRTGVSYEFPNMYRRFIVPGSRFIYYRGRRKIGGGRQPQVYFGSGLVGVVRGSEADSARFTCEILDYDPFPTPVPFRSSDGSYLESDGARKGYFQRGVRLISDETYERILSLGLSEPSHLGFAPSAQAGGGFSYASPETAAAVDEYAIQVATVLVQELFPGQQVVPQPRNNPGFDIRVGADDQTAGYVEVKGTQIARPIFLLTEGERRFSLEHPDHYSFIVVSRVDLEARTHETWIHHGPLTERHFELRPIQWRGEPRAELDEDPSIVGS